MTIEPLNTLPPELTQLSARASAEGFDNVARLVEEYERGINRFDRVGEVLLGAWIDERLVAVCGLNRDPYTPDILAGRIRRLYVDPLQRRQGVATALIECIESLARGHYSRLQLFTPSSEACAFYRALGYRRVEGRLKVTHEKVSSDFGSAEQHDERQTGIA